jgi:phosphopantetheinyl transferase (holo-ACP synthase)
MIVGIGLDVVEVAKVRELLAGQPTFEERVFTPAERARVRGVTQLHVSLTHSAGVAAAAVILEG